MGEFQHRVAALAGCRTAVVATGWIISQHVSTNGHKNHSTPLVGAPFLGLQAFFRQEERSLVKEL